MATIIADNQFLITFTDKTGTEYTAPFYKLVACDGEHPVIADYSMSLIDDDKYKQSIELPNSSDELKILKYIKNDNEFSSVNFRNIWGNDPDGTNAVLNQNYLKTEKNSKFITKGYCPIHYPPIFSNYTHVQNTGTILYVYKINDLDNNRIARLSTNFYIKFKDKEGIQISFNNKASWTTLANSKNSKIIIIDLIGGGGGGGAGHSDKPFMGNWSVAGGGGGEAGGTISILLNLAAFEYLYVTIGAGGAGGKGEVNVNNPNNNGSNGGNTTLQDSTGTIIASALGGYGGKGGYTSNTAQPGGSSGNHSTADFIQPEGKTSNAITISRIAGDYGGSGGGSTDSDNSYPTGSSGGNCKFSDGWSPFEHSSLNSSWSGGVSKKDTTKGFKRISHGGGGGASFASNGGSGVYCSQGIWVSDIGLHGAGGGGGCGYLTDGNSLNSGNGWQGSNGAAIIHFETTEYAL